MDSPKNLDFTKIQFPSWDLIEQKIIITYDVSQLEKSTSTAAIKVNPEMPNHLELDDSSFKNYALKILLQSIADVFYRSFLEPLIEIGKSSLKDIEQGLKINIF